MRRRLPDRKVEESGAIPDGTLPLGFRVSTPRSAASAL